jgi:ubiquinone/menaquinone biosynthesis C-methylase UbiE
MLPAPALRRLLWFGFRLLYNELAFTYDAVSWTVSAGQWRSWQRAALPYLRGKRVLEVGHGTGNMLLDLLSLGFEPVGLDLSRAMGRIAGAKLRRALGAPEPPAGLVRGRVEALPVSSEAFDSVLSTFPTEYVAAPAAIAEFRRVLRPGGVFVTVPAASITGLAPTDRLAEWLFRVTGQTGESLFAPLLGRYRAAGFEARAEWVRLKRSVVTVVIGHKP